VRVRVLGSAAGGGFPQWNCGCDNCRGVRAGTLAATPRGQECVAVSADARTWVLLNAPPDVGAHLASWPVLHPRARRDSPVAAIVLTSGELDHCLGLLVLRESQPIAVYATAAVRDCFARNAAVAALSAVVWRALELGLETEIRGAAGEATGLAVEARAVPGRVPGWSSHLVRPSPEDVVALRVRAGDARLAYCPGAARVDDAVMDALDGVDACFFDGTFWSSDELIRAGLGTRRAEDMAHVPVSDGLARLAGVTAKQRILIHLNNTNPLLVDDGPERAEANARGWEVAHDGMELRL
jgi:pyrroloquinoline quinone biosynthesis protein B